MASSVKASLVVVIAILGLVELTYGYGFRYRFDPYTSETRLWSHLPGMEQPNVYDNNLVVPQSAVEPLDNPGLYKYTGPNGKQRWRCKADAYYSEFFQKCIWKPEHFNRKRF